MFGQSVHAIHCAGSFESTLVFSNSSVIQVSFYNALCTAPDPSTAQQTLILCLSFFYVPVQRNRGVCKLNFRRLKNRLILCVICLRAHAENSESVLRLRLGAICFCGSSKIDSTANADPRSHLSSCPCRELGECALLALGSSFPRHLCVPSPKKNHFPNHFSLFL